MATSKNPGDVVLTRKLADSLIENWKRHQKKMATSKIDAWQHEAQGIQSCIDGLKMVIDVRDQNKQPKDVSEVVEIFEQLMSDEELFDELMLLLESIMSASMRIAERRKKLGLTQQELADLLGIHVQRVNAFETGKRNPMTMEVQTAIKIAKALSTTVEKLFERG